MKEENSKGCCSMPKFHKHILVLVVLVLLYWLGSWIWTLLPISPFYMVQTTSGSMYFGKLMRFPHLTLTNVYQFQLTGDQTNPYAITKFTESVLKPVDKIEINSRDVAIIAKLSGEGQIGAYLKDPAKVAAEIQQQQAQQQQQAPATTTPTTKK